MELPGPERGSTDNIQDLKNSFAVTAPIGSLQVSVFVSLLYVADRTSCSTYSAKLKMEIADYSETLVNITILILIATAVKI